MGGVDEGESIRGELRKNESQEGGEMTELTLLGWLVVVASGRGFFGRQVRFGTVRYGL